jgi:hypothetical protein
MLRRFVSWFFTDVALVAGATLLALSGGSATARAEEFCFGFYELRDGVPYAVQGQTWTFDHGAPDSLEGWRGAHLYGPDDYDVIRRRSLEDFAGDGLPPGAPIIDGEGMIWAGVHQDEADSLCYLCGLGSGNLWSQRMVSLPLPYEEGDVTLKLQYWTETNPDILLGHLGLNYEIVTHPEGYRAFLGGHSGIYGSWDNPINEIHEIPASEFYFYGSYPDSVVVRVIVRSPYDTDQDCGFDSQFGAFGVDNIELTGGINAYFDFESGPQGWTTELDPVGPPGVHVDVHNLSDYSYGWDEWPDCPLEENVMTFHDGDSTFSTSFDEIAISPIIDLSQLNLVTLDAAWARFHDLQDYDWFPGIVYGLFARFYPETCSVTGREQWSEWGLRWSHVVGVNHQCNLREVDFLQPVSGVPDSLQIALWVSVCRGCSGYDDEPSNASPVFDNIQVCIEGLTPSSVGEPREQAVGRHLSYRLGPNPLTASSVLRLDVRDEPVPVRMTLHDPSGRRLATLLDQVLDPGHRQIPLRELIEASTLRDRQRLGSGLYFLRVETPEASRVIKLLIVQ